MEKITGKEFASFLISRGIIFNLDFISVPFFLTFLVPVKCFKICSNFVVFSFGATLFFFLMNAAGLSQEIYFTGIFHQA